VEKHTLGSKPPEKETGMTFMRLACFVLGAIGLGMSIIAGAGAKSWLLTVVLGLFLGAPFFFALAAWPRRWFVPGESKESGAEKAGTRAYTLLDYLLLAGMVLMVVPLLLLRRTLSQDVQERFNPPLVVIILVIAAAYCAFMWQRKASIGKPGLIGSAALTFFGAIIVFSGDGVGGAADSLFGYAFLYGGLWSLLRLALMAIIARQEVPVIGDHAKAPASIATMPVEKTAAWKALYLSLPVTSGIVVVLAVIFTLEVLCGIGSLTLAPNLYTLVAFGALYHPLLMEQHQWYRLLSPALLHANPLHLFFNCYALFLVGLVLERFIGRAWFFAVFVLGAVGGSLMSFAINPDQLISVGASGAIMALFAAALATSVRRPDPAARKALQKWLAQILVLSLIPVMGFGGGRIDISAHLGGALTGLGVGALLWAIWDKVVGKPRLRELALAISTLGLAGFAYTAVPAMQHYQEYVQEATHDRTLQQEAASRQQKNDAALAAAKRGYAYESGKGVKQDYIQAFQWYSKAAQDGNVYAQGALGRLYENGQGIPADLSKAIQWYGSAAAEGDADAEHQMARLYRLGLGVSQDYVQARAWYAKSAAHGDVGAENGLGEMYQYALGGPKDIDQAVKWYRAAALKGYAGAELHLGWLYETGEGVGADYEQARDWLRKAADQEQPDAQDAYGYLFEKGWGVPQDYAQAFYWYKKAAEQGQGAAEDNLGYYYEHGQGVDQDYAQALAWFNKSAAGGNAFAELSLGIMYVEARGVSRDYQRGFDLVQKSAQQGHGPAEEYLGYLYERGLGVQADRAIAAKWYTAAAKQGSKTAAASLVRLGAPVPGG